MTPALSRYGSRKPTPRSPSRRRRGVAAVTDGTVRSLMAFEIRDGRITRLDVLADPERLAALDAGPVMAGQVD